MNPFTAAVEIRAVLVALVIATAGVCPLGSVALSQEAPQAEGPSADQPEASKRAKIHELLGLDESFFSGFVDREPVDPAENEKLLLLMHRLERLPAATAQRVSQVPRTVAGIGAHPDRARGEMIWVRGMATRAERLDVPAELRERFGFDSYYRVTIDSIGAQAVVYSRRVPKGWPLDQPIAENCSAFAVFAKTLPPAPVDGEEPSQSPRSPTLLLVADRIGWYSGSLLGQLFMDVALFDDVQDRTPLTERECFYELLAAVRHARPERIERAAREQLAEERSRMERSAANEHLDPASRADAKRRLERAQEGASDVVPLFNEPAAQRGKLFVLNGEALRAIEVRVDDPDIVKRFDIHHYYEIELITPDSQNNPIVCCVAEVPPGMPLGVSIHEGVRVTGFFLKSWAFDTPDTKSGAASSGAKRKQLAPLLVARSIEWQPSRAALPPQSIKLAIGLVAVLAALAAAMLYVHYSDRRARAGVAAARRSLPEGVSLDTLADGTNAGSGFGDQR
jgi:hypothetical protein